MDDDDGTERANGREIVLEQYITHIRVTEDSSYPQTPHPPDSPSANKERIIIVAVRNTGRVRVHKARENQNHTFSIGKTWNLDELSAVQSWLHFQPRTADEEQQKIWARDVGFTVTMSKPYYWQASTSKEKDFFVASLVKIYRKYTNGKVPELVGFQQREVEQMLGGAGAGQMRSPSGGSPGPPPQIPAFSPGRARGPSGDVPASSPQLPLEPPARNRPPTASSTQGSFFSQRAPSSSSTPPPGSMYSSEAPQREPMRMPSREQMRPPGRITPSASMSNLAAPRDRTPDSFGSRPNTAGRGAERRSPSRTREEVGSRDGPRGPNGLGISGRPNGGPPPSDPAIMPPLPRPGPPGGFGSTGRMRNGSSGSQDSLPETALPERRRPPMMAATSNGSQSSFKSPPLTAGLRPAAGAAMPGALPASANASTDSLLRGREKMPGGFVPSPAPSQDIEKEGLLPAPLSPKPKIEPATVTSPLSQTEEVSKPAPMPPQADGPTDSKEESKGEPAPAEPTPEVSSPKKEEDGPARPGLGRMFGNKQKSAKEMFKSAASTYNAFVPRAGGAGARMRAGTTEESDGISSVFQRRNLDRTRTDDSMQSTQTTESGKDESSIQATPTSVKAPASEQPPEIPPADTVPQVTVSSPLSPPKTAATPLPAQMPDPEVEAAAQAQAQAAQKKAKREEEERKRKRRSVTQMKYLSHLGIDTQILENKGLDFESVLDQLGWGTTTQKSKTVDALELDIRREIARVEAGSWLGHVNPESKDERVDAVEKLLDKTIAECDELDGLLTLYSVELSSLNDDIAFIEAQSQGLQVQTANQKLLQLELQNLVKTISIGARELEPLKRPMPSNTNPQGLEAIEKALLMLYKAMVTIDPSIRQNSRPSQLQNGAGALMGTNELSNMIALQEKSDQYMAECSMFLKRFTQHMDLTFGAAMLTAQDIVSRGTGPGAGAKLSNEPYEAARAGLWQYSPLMLFAKEVDRPSWDVLMRMYQSRAKPVYTDVFAGNVTAWKGLTIKPSGDEDGYLFTHTAERENENMAATARRITVKRSQTLARGLRQASSEKDKDRKTFAPGSMHPPEAFKGALDEMTALIAVEQNFLVDFFHATATESLDFSDAVAVALPENRRGGDIYKNRAFEPDRELAKRVAGGMDDIFSSFDRELTNLIAWATSSSPLYGVGVMYALSKTGTAYEDTNQDFLNRIVSGAVNKLGLQWTRFIDEQIRAIEGTKVKVDKRKGVVSFVKTFPDFSAAIENQLPRADEESAAQSTVRADVDKAYSRINTAIFATVRKLGREIQNSGGAGASTLGAAREEIEEKNALNALIFGVECCNHYVEGVEGCGDEVLEQGREMAREEMEECLGRYVESVVRRPLGKMMVSLVFFSLFLCIFLPMSGISKADADVMNRTS